MKHKKVDDELSYIYTHSGINSPSFNYIQEIQEKEIDSIKYILTYTIGRISDLSWSHERI